LVSLLGLSLDATATAVNGHHVAREQRAGHGLRQGDQILLFRPIVGG
jgi:sulfur carrier protein ThiS